MPANPTSRYAALDLLRGLAMVWMTLFHFSFDLQHFGFLQANFYTDPFWTLQRTAIVSLFVFCAGLGQAIAVQQGQSWGRFWKRWGQIALCALAVSAASFWMFPNGYIYFGILHGMAVMLLVVRLLAFTSWGGGWRLCLLGGLALLLPALAMQAHALWPGLDFLNERVWNWLGLISRKPLTEDYAPLLPWLGVMCFGLGTGQWLLHRHAAALQVGVACARGAPGVPFRGLAFLGRWSLSYYMLHQPLLMGALGLLAWLRSM
jgi:uncharacterized membrane protein